MQQTLFLMVGYPGSGKTTASKIIHEQTGAVHVWADEERKIMFKEPTYTHDENLALYAKLNAHVAHLLSEGKSVIFDTNFNFYRDRDRLRDIATKYNTQTVIVWVKTPLELAKRRAVHFSHGRETRVFGNMPVDHFDRIVHNLQEPRDDEHPLILDGTKILPETIAAALKNL